MFDWILNVPLVVIGRNNLQFFLSIFFWPVEDVFSEAAFQRSQKDRCR